MPKAYSSKGNILNKLEAVFSPTTVLESIELLMRFQGRARIIAGGTDLVLLQKTGKISVGYLVDITNIEPIKGIREEENNIIIGAATTLEMVASSKSIQRYAPGLATAAAEVGAPQIREMGTIGGNVINAQPAADTALALISLGAQARVYSVNGEKWERVSDLFIQPGLSAVDPTQEILTDFAFPKPSGNFGAAFRRFGKCKSIALPVFCAAATVKLDETCNFFLDGKIVIGPVAPRPLLLTKVSEWLKDKPVDDYTLETAAKMAQESAHPRDSLLRCSAEYREAMVGVLVQDVMEKAVQNSRSLKG